MADDIIPSTLKFNELRTELKQRGLSAKGKKVELITRLEDALYPPASESEIEPSDAESEVSVSEVRVDNTAKRQAAIAEWKDPRTERLKREAELKTLNLDKGQNWGFRVNYDEVVSDEKTKPDDIEDMISDFGIQIKKNTLIPADQRETIRSFVKDLWTIDTYDEKVYRQMYGKLRKKFKANPKKSQISYMYRSMVYKKELPENPILKNLLVTKKMRSQSGVIVVSVIMGPENFSCSKDCYYCPDYPDIARSYIPDEPTVERGRRNKFDARLQFMERITTYFINGHPIDKIEVIVLGGTFSCYPKEYQKRFIRDIYYAANTVFDKKKRNKKSLEEEIELNEKAMCGIIGLTLETRPDFISKHEIRRLRSYGCTRVQLGIQHTDDAILELVNRGCTTDDARDAIKLLKDNCFKVDIHLMPDLPGSSLEQDKVMFQKVLDDPMLQADQWKIYPTEVTPHTKIKEWYDDGSYVPYAEDPNELMKLALFIKPQMHRYIRINRFVRDFPGTYILGGNHVTHFRQEVHKQLKLHGLNCRCIRCAEVGDRTQDMKNARLTHLIYPGSEGHEDFISYVSSQGWRWYLYIFLAFLLSLFGVKHSWRGSGTQSDIIYGFVRLRLTQRAGDRVFPELNDCALIRELHVYGQVVAHYDKGSKKLVPQHSGFGRKLLAEAERTARHHGFRKIAVISGVGVRDYYRKFGYRLVANSKGGFLIKDLF